MSIFATEFRVKLGISKAGFVASTVAWLRGINRSTILDAADAQEDYEDEVWLQAPTGETLSLKSFEDHNCSVFGARLEIPDNAGRKWRTECILSQLGNDAFLRIRGQCLALNHSAFVVPPKKPHIIRQAIEDGWCVPDGQVLPSLKPIELKADQLNLASGAIVGGSTSMLPCLYVSRGNQDNLALDADQIAKELAGICHVFVEPSRAFSFDLMEATKRRNPYGGAIALFSPDGREHFRLFKRSDDNSGRALSKECITRVNAIVSSRAARYAWEWQDLQEAQSRKLREAATTSTSVALDDYIEAFDAELSAKQEKIENLEARLALETARADGEALSTEDLFPTELKNRIGPELYDGEFTDRLRSFLLLALENPSSPRNRRTDDFIRRLLTQIQFSGRSSSLISQIKTACRDGNQMPKQLGSLLSGFGFERSSAGKHTKFEPPTDLFGLQTEVLPSTPSDSQRGGKNRGAEVIKNFGLTELK